MENLVMLDLSFWMDRRVLVTGHTGFKGSWLSLWLLQLGAQVWGYALPPEGNGSLFDNLSLKNNFGKFNHHVGDLCDLEALQKLVQLVQPEVVFHLAAQPLVRRSYRDPLRTWATNVQGSLHVLEALKPLNHHCSVVMVTTDKVYANREWDYGYREDDRLGGHDPYSASKLLLSWQLRVGGLVCGLGAHQTPHLVIATARAGNVIGGGDWAEERIVPDAIRALASVSQFLFAIPKRPAHGSTLEPLGGYLLLAERLALSEVATPPFNFGPPLESNRSVRELLRQLCSIS